MSAAPGVLPPGPGALPPGLLGAGPGGTGLLRRAVDAAYAQRQRAAALRWSALNGLLLAVFAYDLSCKCPGYTDAYHWAELALAGALCAALVRHAARLLPASPPGPPAPLTPAQCRLLGLHADNLDSSFCLASDESDARSNSSGGAWSGSADSGDEDWLSLSLSPARAWSPAAGAGSEPPSPPPRGSPPPDDQFIADGAALRRYLDASARAELEASPPAPAPPLRLPPPPAPRYQLAQPHSPERAERSGAMGAGEAALEGSPRLWWRLDVDPRHLTQFNLNLRLWIQVTILERLVREMDAADEALARHGLASYTIGEVSVERLRQLAAGGGEAARRVQALLPFLEPFPDQRYAVRRIRELARGGCLSAYRWSSGGAGWDASRPPDAELVLALVAAYLDAVLPAPPPRPFSARYLSAAPAPPPPLGLHRLRARPPHYAVAVGGDTLEPPPGRNNLLHALLLLLAALARPAAGSRAPPTLHRLALHRAGLNMLWIIGKD